jgi:hypothetical protein
MLTSALTDHAMPTARSRTRCRHRGRGHACGSSNDRNFSRRASPERAAPNSGSSSSLFEPRPAATRSAHLNDIDVLDARPQLASARRDRRSRLPGRSLDRRDPTFTQHLGLDTGPASTCALVHHRRKRLVLPADQVFDRHRNGRSRGASEVHSRAPLTPGRSGCFCTGPNGRRSTDPGLAARQTRTLHGRHRSGSPFDKRQPRNVQLPSASMAISPGSTVMPARWHRLMMLAVA